MLSVVKLNGKLNRNHETVYVGDILKHRVETSSSNGMLGVILKRHLEMARFNVAADKLTTDAARLETELEAAQVQASTLYFTSLYWQEH